MVGKPADRACLHHVEEPLPLESSGRSDRSRTDCFGQHRDRSK